MVMPRPRQDDRWRVVARRLRLLLVLVAAGEPLDSQELMREAGYEASQARRPGQSEAQRLASRKRLLTGDLRLFRERGLVRTRKHLDRRRTTSGVEYVKARNQKPGHMVLNREQHQVLASLRRDLRGDARVRALPTGDPAGALEVERVLLLIRLIEEFEDVPVDDLAVYLGCSRSDLQTWADAVMDVYETKAPYGTIGFEYLDGTDHLARLMLNHDGDTLRHTGLYLAGLFPYSKEEVGERLALIAQAQKQLPDTDDRVAALPEIEKKLRGWRQQLRRQRD
jgi:hypothetical protein